MKWNKVLILLMLAVVLSTPAISLAANEYQVTDPGGSVLNVRFNNDTGHWEVQHQPYYGTNSNWTDVNSSWELSRFTRDEWPILKALKGRNFDWGNRYFSALFSNDTGYSVPKSVDKSAATAPQLKVEIGGSIVSLSAVNCTSGQDCSIPWIGEYMKQVYIYLVAVAAILATVMIMIGGFLWLTSGGSPDRISRGKEFIVSSISGMLLALFSYIILYSINPNLINLKPIVIKVSGDLAVQAQNRSNAQAATQSGPTALGAGCPDATESAQGYTAVLTSYARPTPQNFTSDDAFLCAVGLNCSCPSGTGRDNGRSCSFGSLTWHPCVSFDANTTPYCNQTASGQAPRVGTVAADPCFPFGTQLCINGETYTVTDRGSAITGRHFDLWSDDYSAATRAYSNSAQVTGGPCP
ncbi:MAG: hypothetical protein PHW95_02785 [Patescibacteria group bacterium]|nr:hypothetical protein [Patescibacteria group bacterium]